MSCNLQWRVLRPNFRGGYKLKNVVNYLNKILKSIDLNRIVLLLFFFIK